MANYCKKSSLDAVVSAIKTNAGISAATPISFGDIASTISSLVTPTQRGNPSTVLNSSNKTYTIQRGEYTGGSVSVAAQSKTATLSADGSTVSPDGSKVLSSVVIPASNVYTPASGSLKPATKGATSISITNLGFQPVGIIMIYASESSGLDSSSSIVKKPYIGGLMWINGTVSGLAAGSVSPYGVPITSATVSTTATSITVSDIVATESAGAFAATFFNKAYAYFVWG